ncbi:MAG: AAR2 pre-mRNA splicing protein [Chloroflexi bacterium]|nr:AAR2 pre-mRNA splicing protein [Chloroflexota bacterium]
MFGAIVLRDVPKEEARIDLLTYPIQGGFRGFRMVPPGVHYVSVLAGEAQVGFWCVVRPNTAVVRRLDFATNQFVADDPDTEANFQQMALSGSMNHVLLEYNHTHFAAWWRLVDKIDTADFPPLPTAEGAGSRFERALGEHGGRAERLLGEIQYQFVTWLVTQPTAPDEAAFARWRHLVLACYNAGERNMIPQPEFFRQLIPTLLAQFHYLPDSWFTADSFLVAQASYMAEDMTDSDIPELATASEEWRTYLAERTT